MVSDCEMGMHDFLFDVRNRVNYDNLITIMSEDSLVSLAKYEMAKNILINAGILSDHGYVVKAYGIINMNPREAVNCGNQLYFPQKIDVMRYAMALQKTGELDMGNYTFEYSEDN